MSDEFTKLVDKCKRWNSPRIIHNASIRHAAYLFDALLGSALKGKERVRVVSGSLKDDFYNPLTPKFEKCLERGIEVDVIALESRDFSDSELVALLKTHTNGKFTVKDSVGEEFPHFIVVGDKRFRGETDHERSKAIASFNAPEVGEMLNHLFDYLNDSNATT